MKNFKPSRFLTLESTWFLPGIYTYCTLRSRCYRCKSEGDSSRIFVDSPELTIAIVKSLRQVCNAGYNSPEKTFISRGSGYVPAKSSLPQRAYIRLYTQLSKAGTSELSYVARWGSTSTFRPPVRAPSARINGVKIIVIRITERRRER